MRPILAGFLLFAGMFALGVSAEHGSIYVILVLAIISICVATLWKWEAIEELLNGLYFGVPADEKCTHDEVHEVNYDNTSQTICSNCGEEVFWRDD